MEFFRINSNQPVLKNHKDLVIYNEGKYLKLFSIKKNDLIKTFEDTCSITTILLIILEQQIITGNKKGEINFYDLNSKSKIYNFKINNFSITNLTYDKKNKILFISSKNGKIFFFNKKNNTITQEYNSGLNIIKKITTTKNDNILLTGINTLQKIDIKNKKCLNNKKIYSKEISVLKYISKQNLIITGASGENIKILNYNDFSLYKELQTKDSFSISISNCESYLLTTNMKGCLLFDLNSFVLIQEFNFDSMINVVVFLNDLSFFTVNSKCELIKHSSKIQIERVGEELLSEESLDFENNLKISIRNNFDKDNIFIKKNNLENEVKILNDDKNKNFYKKEFLNDDNKEKKDINKNIKKEFLDNNDKINPDNNKNDLVNKLLSNLKDKLHNKKKFSVYTQNNSIVHNEFSIYNNQNSVNNFRGSFRNLKNEKIGNNNNFRGSFRNKNENLNSEFDKSGNNSLLPDYNSNFGSQKYSFNNNKRALKNEKNIINLNYSKQNFDLISERSELIPDLKIKINHQNLEIEKLTNELRRSKKIIKDLKNQLISQKKKKTETMEKQKMKEEKQKKGKEMENLNFLQDVKIFEGTLINGKKNGICLEVFSEDEYYKANYINNIKEGLIEIKQSDIIIRGNAINDIICGMIEIYFLNSKITILGTTENFNFDPNSIHIHSLKTENTLIKNISGIFDSDKFNGYAQITFKNGSYLKGIIENNKIIRGEENIDNGIVIQPENEFYRIKNFKNNNTIETYEDQIIIIDEEKGILQKYEEYNINDIDEKNLKDNIDDIINEETVENNLENNINDIDQKNFDNFFEDQSDPFKDDKLSNIEEEEDFESYLSESGINNKKFEESSYIEINDQYDDEEHFRNERNTIESFKLRNKISSKEFYQETNFS